MTNDHQTPTSRRNFLKTSSALAAGAALTEAIALPGYTAESNDLKITLVGCGGRGTSAASEALSTKGPISTVA
jgi:myo-inositol 2-dehydrogenase/D-chiro-inositol 1-dehydrogenase